MSKRLLNMNNFNILAICKFYSRIVLNKLCSETKTCFRASENILTKCIKLNADLSFLKFCVNNQLLPKFTNFKLYDVSLQHEPATIVFKKNLLDSEIKTKEQKLQQLTLESAKCLVQLRGMTVGNL